MLAAGAAAGAIGSALMSGAAMGEGRDAGRESGGRLVTAGALGLAQAAMCPPPPSPPPPPPRDALSPQEIAAAAAAWRAAKDEEPIHVFHTVCAASTPPQDLGFDGLLVVKTALAARANGASWRRRYHFHIVIDEGFRRLMAGPPDTMLELRDTLAFIANRTDDRVTVTYYDLDLDVLAATDAAVGADAAAAVNNAGFKQCSSVRLKVPFVGGALLGTDRVIYADMDAVVNCDLERLWEEEFAAMDAAAAAAAAAAAGGSDAAAGRQLPLFSFTEESPHRFYPSAYLEDPSSPSAVKFPTKYVTGMNAGVFIARLDRWRAVGREYWGQVGEIMATGGYAAYNLSVHGKGGLTYYDQVRRGGGGRGDGWEAVVRETFTMTTLPLSPSSVHTSSQPCRTF
jgi:hypothetical protein